MDARQRRDLDNYITGHYGEDQYRDIPERLVGTPRNTVAARTISHELVLAWEDIQSAHDGPEWHSAAVRMESAMDRIIAAYTPGYNAESSPDEEWAEDYSGE
jgi:hypothetical protein